MNNENIFKNSISIDVVTCFYKQLQYLPRCIHSVIDQLNEGERHIIVNDGDIHVYNILEQLQKNEKANDINVSDLTSLEVLERYIYSSKHSFINNIVNLGPSISRNMAISDSTADWIKFLDADDLLAPFALNCLRNISPDRLRNVHVVIGSSMRVQDGIYFGKCFNPNPIEGIEKFNPFLSSMVFIRRSTLLELGGYNEDLRFEEDWDLWLRIWKRYGDEAFLSIDYPVCYYWNSIIVEKKYNPIYVRQVREYLGGKFAINPDTSTLNDSAKEFYLKRLKMKTSREEVYHCLFQLGMLAVIQNESDEYILKTFMACYNYEPTRAEALYQLAVYFRSIKKYEQGYLCAKEASNIVYPSEDIQHFLSKIPYTVIDNQFVSKEIYDYKIHDELQICAWWTQRYEESYELAMLLLANPNVPPNELPRLQINFDFAAEKVGIIKTDNSISILEETLKSLSEKPNPSNNIIQESNMTYSQASINIPKKIIELKRLGGFGDLIMLTSVLAGLKAQGYTTRVMCEAYFKSILENHPDIDELLYNPPGQNIESIQRDLAERSFWLDYPNHSETGLVTEPMKYHAIDYFCALANVPVNYELTIPLSEEILEWGVQFKDCVLIQTKAYFSAYKDWSLSRWEELAYRIQSELGYEVRQLGSADDPEIPGIPKIMSPNILYAFGALKACHLFIGLDSAFNHASQAFKKKSIILWGSSNPAGFGYPQNINLVNGVEWNPTMGNGPPLLPCQPCYRHHDQVRMNLLCPNTIPDKNHVIPGHDLAKPALHLCMAGNTVESVFVQAQKLLFEKTSTKVTIA